MLTGSLAGDVSSDRLALELGLWRLWEVQEEASSDRGPLSSLPSFTPLDMHHTEL